jgi:hypothetical protein
LDRHVSVRSQAPLQDKSAKRGKYDGGDNVDDLRGKLVGDPVADDHGRDVHSLLGRGRAEDVRVELLEKLGDRLLPVTAMSQVATKGVKPPKIITATVKLNDTPINGAQEGSAYNVHFGCTCYHPLFVFNQLGDLERCALRSGNVHSAASWREVLEPVVARYRGTVKRCCFRGDAAFANPEIYEFLEAEGMGYAIRLPANRVLQDKIGYLLKRPVGRPPQEVRRYYASFRYQAGSWTKPRRVVAKVEWHPGELYPRVGFIVTNLARPVERLVAFYNHRGTCEQYIKEGKGAVKWTRLSCRSFAANAVRLQLHALAYNLGNFMRTLAMPKTAEPWSLTSLREKLIKIGAKVVSHGRYTTFQMAEVAVPRQMFQEILMLIAQLRAPPAPA